MKGDLVEVFVGDKMVGMTADAAGRSLSVETEKESGLAWLVVTELTRGGTVVQQAKFQMSEVKWWRKG